MGYSAQDWMSGHFYMILMSSFSVRKMAILDNDQVMVQKCVILRRSSYYLFQYYFDVGQKMEQLGMEQMRFYKWWYASGVMKMWFFLGERRIIISEQMGSRYLLMVMDFPERPRNSQLNRQVEQMESLVSRPVARRRPSRDYLMMILYSFFQRKRKSQMVYWLS